MANIVITGVNGFIKVDFNELAVSIDEVYFNRNGISEVLKLTGGGVAITMSHTKGMATSYQVSFDGTKGMQVDTVDGVAPTSDSDLTAKIAALITA